MGDPRGRWDGQPLVVDTINLLEKNEFRGSAEHLHLVERFTRVDGNTIDYRFTVDDPTTFTTPWTASFPLKKINERCTSTRATKATREAWKGFSERPQFSGSGREQGRKAARQEGRNSREEGRKVEGRQKVGSAIPAFLPYRLEFLPSSLSAFLPCRHQKFTATPTRMMRGERIDVGRRYVVPTPTVVDCAAYWLVRL